MEQRSTPNPRINFKHDFLSFVKSLHQQNHALIITGDFPIVLEFLRANPMVLRYNIITAITSASGQLCIFYTIKEFGPIVFTIIMTTRQMISICISAIAFGHFISLKAFVGAALVFSVLFYQIRRKYRARRSGGGAAGGGGR